MDGRLRLTAYDRSMARRGPIRAPEEVSFIPRWNAPSECSFVLPAGHRRLDDLRTPGARVVVEYLPDGQTPDPGLTRSGVVIETSGSSGLAGRFEFTVHDDLAEILNLLGWPNPTGTISQQGDDSAYWTRTGPAETIVLQAIAANATRLAVPLTVPASQGRGGTATVALRMHPLADKLPPILEAAGLGLVVVQQAGQRLVRVDAQRVYTREPFSEASGVVQAGSWSVTAPTVTRVVVGAGGEGKLRLFRLYVNTALEVSWRPREVFVDARDIDTDLVANPDRDLQMQERADKELAAGAGKSSVAASLAETTRFRFGKTFTLGDRVPIQLQGSPVITDLVREATITWSAHAGLTVEPKVGLWQDSPEAGLHDLVGRMAREQRDRRTI